jgi:plastocyanin
MNIKSIFPLLAATSLLGATCWFQPVINKNAENDNIYIPVDQNQTNDSANANLPLQPHSFQFVGVEHSQFYRSSVPKNQDILPQAPLAVVIDSTEPLGTLSSISVQSQGIEYGVAKTTTDASGTTIRRSLDHFAPTGLYTVHYQLCDVADSCQAGQFQFGIDPFWLTQYQDWTHLEQIDIQLRGAAFLPRYVRITAGTTVTWENHDDLDQAILSDPKDTHTYFPSLVSDNMPFSGTYSYTFTLPGLYPYHAGAFPDNMTGMIIVE